MGVHRSAPESLDRGSGRIRRRVGQEVQANSLSLELQTGSYELEFSESGVTVLARVGIVSEAEEQQKSLASHTDQGGDFRMREERFTPAEG
jgi:hypothetical protein